MTLRSLEVVEPPILEQFRIPKIDRSVHVEREYMREFTCIRSGTIQGIGRTYTSRNRCTKNHRHETSQEGDRER